MTRYGQALVLSFSLLLSKLVRVPTFRRGCRRHLVGTRTNFLRFRARETALKGKLGGMRPFNWRPGPDPRLRDRLRKRLYYFGRVSPGRSALWGPKNVGMIKWRNQGRAM
jgi:hypothetical protein